VPSGCQQMRIWCCSQLALITGIIILSVRGSYFARMPLILHCLCDWIFYPLCIFKLAQSLVTNLPPKELPLMSTKTRPLKGTRIFGMGSLVSVRKEK
jgi:hypothetical protein